MIDKDEKWRRINTFHMISHLDMKGVYLPLYKWQIHPFISKNLCYSLRHQVGITLSGVTLQSFFSGENTETSVIFGQQIV